ncbi:MAG TPA: sulfatase/phosphatase domain-containing protein, partial [Pirellulales bacterium]
AAYNTLVLFLSDNGAPFPRCKTTLYDSGIGTPFIIRWPRQVLPERTSVSLVSSIDIAPTVLELAGVARSPTLQGVSLVPLLTDPAARVRSSIMAEHNWHDYSSYDRAVRTDHFKYIRNGYLDLPLTPPADAVGSPTFQAMRRLLAEGRLTPAQRVCFQTPRPAEELYDLRVDPQEMHNVAAEAEYAGELTKLRKLLDEWRQQTHDRMPQVRTPDEFDRQTGKPLGPRHQRVASPELRAEQGD